jgi:multisubunit Na+/H+ antiporter MnhB subunit
MAWYLFKHIIIIIIITLLLLLATRQKPGSKHSPSYRFHWTSVRVVYTVAVLFTLLFMVLFCSLYTLQIGGSFQDARKCL